MALVALAFRSRLPWSVVFWNLRTRSSASNNQSHVPLSPSIPSGDLIPDEPLDSSPDTFEPDLMGKSIVSMVRVVVRAGAAILHYPDNTVPFYYHYNNPLVQADVQMCIDGLQASCLDPMHGYADISKWGVRSGEATVVVESTRDRSSDGK